MLDSLLDGLFPLVCPGCGRRGDPLCATCAERVHPAPPASPPPGVDAWSAPFAYEGVAREIVARVKYRGARAAIPWLADAMVSALSAHLPWARRLDVVTWAPTTRQRRVGRGFDPAELLARAVARRLRSRCVGLLERGPGPPQTGLNRVERRVGPRYSARRAVPASVLVVDDVATTGATLAAATAALRRRGARLVVATTAARTPAPAPP